MQRDPFVRSLRDGADTYISNAHTPPKPRPKEKEFKIRHRVGPDPLSTGLSFRALPKATIGELVRVCQHFEKKAAGHYEAGSRATRFLFDLSREVQALIEPIVEAEEATHAAMLEAQRKLHLWEHMLDGQPQLQAGDDGKPRAQTPAAVRELLSAAQKRNEELSLALVRLGETSEDRVARLEQIVAEHTQSAAARTQAALAAAAHTHAETVRDLHAQYEARLAEQDQQWRAHVVHLQEALARLEADNDAHVTRAVAWKAQVEGYADLIARLQAELGERPPARAPPSTPALSSASRRAVAPPLSASALVRPHETDRTRSAAVLDATRDQHTRGAAVSLSSSTSPTLSPVPSPSRSPSRSPSPPPPRSASFFAARSADTAAAAAASAAAEPRTTSTSPALSPRAAATEAAIARAKSAAQRAAVSTSLHRAMNAATATDDYAYVRRLERAEVLPVYRDVAEKLGVTLPPSRRRSPSPDARERSISVSETRGNAGNPLWPFN